MGRWCIVLIDGLEDWNDNDCFNRKFAQICCMNICLLNTEMINWVIRNSLGGVIVPMRLINK